MNKYAVITSDSNPLYAAFLPLTALFWESVGYKTLCVLTSEFQLKAGSGVLAHVRRWLEMQPCVEIHEVGDVAGFKPSTISQVARLVGAAAPLEDDAYLLTGDADMFPFSRDYFNHQDFSAWFHVFSADVYGPPTNRHFQMCYLGGTKAAWKSLMGLGCGDLTRELETLLRGRSDSWFLDEGILAEKMVAWSEFDKCQMISRGYPPAGYAPNRLDRGCWNLPDDLSSLIDCHSARPLQKHWEVIEQLVDHFLPAASRELAKDYVKGLQCL